MQTSPSLPRSGSNQIRYPITQHHKLVSAMAFARGMFSMIRGIGFDSGLPFFTSLAPLALSNLNLIVGHVSKGI